MSLYIETMIQEREELLEKVNKLENFILNNPIFKNLPECKRVMMEKQFALMLDYEEVLTERISLEN